MILLYHITLYYYIIPQAHVYPFAMGIVCPQWASWVSGVARTTEASDSTWECTIKRGLIYLWTCASRVRITCRSSQNHSESLPALPCWPRGASSVPRAQGPAPWPRSEVQSPWVRITCRSSQNHSGWLPPSSHDGPVGLPAGITLSNLMPCAGTSDPARSLGVAEMQHMGSRGIACSAAQDPMAPLVMPRPSIPYAHP